MHVKELKAALTEIEGVFAAAGAKSQGADMAALIELLEGHEDQDLELFLADLSDDLSAKPAAKATGTKAKAGAADEVTVARYVSRLTQAGTDQERFGLVFAELEADSSVRKSELEQVAAKYGAAPAASRPKLLNAIKSRFFERVYERDASEMARRATPW